MASPSIPQTRVATPTLEEKSKIEWIFSNMSTTDITKRVETIVVDAIDKDMPTKTLADSSPMRKAILMVAMCLAQFLDVVNNSALFPAIPALTRELGFLPSETVWLISAYSLTFAAFLLVSGRISDVYSPKPAFVTGALILSLTKLCGGFARQKIALVVLRALSGSGAALTIPSALTLITQIFPDEKSQGRAIAIFGGVGAIGNILGLIIGALFIEYASWSWIFWFTTILGSSVALTVFVLIPSTPRAKKNAKFDVLGVSIMASGIVLFIFAVTSAASEGWGSARVLAPLIISILLVALFFFWEARTDPQDAVLPPSIWKYANVPVLAALALLPYCWWTTQFTIFMEWWQHRYGWSVMNSAIHFMPLGIFATLWSFVVGYLPRWFEHKHILLCGGVLTIIASTLLPFSSSPDTYWPITAVAFVLGTTGCTFLFSNANIAIFASTPSSVAGTVGAVFNSCLQIGAAVGLALVITVQASISQQKGSNSIQNPQSKSEWRQAFQGQFAALWFLFGLVVLETLSVLIFFKTDATKKPAEEIDAEPKEKESRTDTLEV